MEVKSSYLRRSHLKSSSEAYKQTNHSKITNIILETHLNLNAISSVPGHKNGSFFSLIHNLHC